ncbi:MAG: FRG domain-containing protein [Clostridiales bacterium]|nr:FRG domain-containing protein [Clostridiales bacterium]
MIETVIVDSIEKVMDLISDQKYNPEIDRMRSTYLYRGMPSASYNLTTSLRLNCKQKHKELESSILRNFTKYASMDEPTLNASVWQQMIVGQHHGLPTRLLDWTRSPLIALHFAETEQHYEKFDKRDCVVWRIDMKEINKTLPKEYSAKLKEDNACVFSVDSLKEVADTLEKYDKDMGNSSFVNVEPSSVDQRIVNQYSFFSIIPSGMDNIEEFLDKCTESTKKYVIKKEIRWSLRDLLDQYNISERIMYPGLDGLSKSLARHYYVK